MGNFILVIADEQHTQSAERLFKTALRLAPEIKGQKQNKNVLTRSNLWIAGFTRQNGSGGMITTNPETGDWLLSVGTWFCGDVSGSEREKHLLALIRDKGAGHAARNLEGFFTIVGSTRDKEVFVITDIIGSCHAFSRSWDGVTAISGSSLLLAALDEASLDSIACQEFVQGGVIYEDRTLFREVRKLSPATHYCYENGSLVKTGMLLASR